MSAKGHIPRKEYRTELINYSHTNKRDEFIK